jgi:Porin PorA
MRKILAWVLVALGAFLTVAAVVAQTWAPAQVERTPLDTDSTTYLSGSAMKANPAQGYELEPLDVLAFSTNQADAETSDDDVVAWVSTLCLVVDEGDPTGCVDEDDPQGRLISAETDVFATHRHTGMTVNDDEYLPADATPQKGLQNKWPFGAEKKTYPVWDGLAGDAVDATYEGTEDVHGLETYHYVATVDVSGVEVIQGVPGDYRATTDYFIEPRTGTIIDQVVRQERVADGIGPILELDLGFTDDQVEKNVADTEDNLSTLELIEDTVPLVGLVVGIPALLVGVLLLVLDRRKRTTATPAS